MEEISSTLFAEEFYHGTARLIPGEFATNRVAYFAQNKEDAIEHAMMDTSWEGEVPYLIIARLHCTNPAVLDVLTMQDLHTPEHKLLLMKLRAEGYDCALEAEGHISEVAVINPNKIEVLKIINLQND
jgi:hypothetical protein